MSTQTNEAQPIGNIIVIDISHENVLSTEGLFSRLGEVIVSSTLVAKTCCRCHGNTAYLYLDRETGFYSVIDCSLCDRTGIERTNTEVF